MKKCLVAAIIIMSMAFANSFGVFYNVTDFVDGNSDIGAGLLWSPDSTIDVQFSGSSSTTTVKADSDTSSTIAVLGTMYVANSGAFQAGPSLGLASTNSTDVDPVTAVSLGFSAKYSLNDMIALKADTTFLTSVSSKDYSSTDVDLSPTAAQLYATITLF